MKILAGNWKMFKDRAQTRDFFEKLGQKVATSSVRKIIATSPTLMEGAVSWAAKSGVEIFSQNCAWSLEGAFTGEMSPKQLKDLGVKGTLIGHSERRQYFGENDSSCVKRSLCALREGLDVIYCVGESLQEREQGQTKEVLKRQLKGVVAEILPHTNPKHFIVAYEPVWAIGTGLTANSAQISEAHAVIGEFLGADSRYSILYGGSVKADNFKQISALKGVAGGLVGGASLEPSTFLALHQCLIDNA